MAVHMQHMYGNKRVTGHGATPQVSQQGSMLFLQFANLVFMHDTLMHAVR
jgi:hypothetical protein